METQSTLTINNMLEQEKDPFLMARAKSGPTMDSAVFVGGPGMDSNPAQVAQVASPQPTLNTMFKSASGEPISDQKLLDMFKSAGLDTQGLSFNDVGRFNLIGQLQKRFGPDYMTQKPANELLKTFDSYLTQNKDTQSKELADLNSKANRTLGLLRSL